MMCIKGNLSFLFLTSVLGALSMYGEDLRHDGLEGIPIQPSRTDSRIQTFDTPHYVYVDRRILIQHDHSLPGDREELLVFLPGTKGKGRGPIEFLRLAALQGYHVIFLMYPDDVPAAKFKNSNDPDVFEKFRNTILYGGKFEDIVIAKHESIESRLRFLLLQLAKARPRERWDRFLTNSGEIEWSRIALAGQSQGGGHAALLAMQHKVRRVICTGAPKDFNSNLKQPAAWYRKESATPINRFFTFNHCRDRQGCDPAECEENIRTLGLLRTGEIVNVDRAKPPFQGRVFVTDTNTGVTDSKTAHTSVISNRNEFLPLWLYFLTEPTESK